MLFKIAVLFDLKPTLVHFNDTLVPEDTESSVSEEHHNEDDADIGLYCLFDEDVCYEEDESHK